MAGEKPASGQPLLRIVITALFLSLLLTFYFANGWLEERQGKVAQSQTGMQILGNEAEIIIPGSPARLRIPTLNVDTAIESVSYTPQGAMEVPSTITEVGWFELGPKPGEKGSAVIAGHYNGKNGEAGVFAQLNQLKVGDKIYVEDQHQQTFTFVVRESRTYDPGYAEEVFSQNGGNFLNLVTCDGMWDELKNTYNKRLVIFTDLLT